MARIRRSGLTKGASIPQTVWKVGKYIRLSREEGDGESESIINQRKILEEHIQEYFDGDCVVVGEYIDDGRTGTSDDTRPGFLRLVEDVKRARINCIITKNLSRAFRNSANQGKFLEEFIPLYNTRFISLYEPHIDTFLNPEVVHSLEVSITGFINEQYAYKTSVDVRRTLHTKRKKGEFVGAFAPYGLMKQPDDKNRLMIDEEAAAVVRDIFRWFVCDGMSKSGIVRRLNQRGIPNPASYKRKKGLQFCNPQMYKNDGLWNEKTVREILLNPMYIGNMVQGKQKVVSYKVHHRVRTDEKDWYIVEKTHEAIVDRELFDQAQKLHLRDTRAAPGQSIVSLFAGFVRCADCQKAMTRKNAKQYTYYCCSTYSRKSKEACTKHSIRLDRLEKAVRSALQMQITLTADWDAMVEEIRHTQENQTKSRRLEDMVAAKQEELNQLASAADYLYLDWRTEQINEMEYRRIKGKLAEKTAQLCTVIANLQTEIDASAEKNEVETSYRNSFLQRKNMDHLERGLLVELVDAIYVHQNGAITIRFAFDDPYQSMLESMKMHLT